ncbi:type I restriction enzyme, R subunit [Caminicella sporogenes DSM 14501]|uniref:Type I restriction enzyme, R subunit n=1 Tax=Caminicella sporogenes DSM 14501 TaxID=1121266 RepID=A0A1M6RHG2_9FIRM|nr:type I restriction endonuclease subunit R [Caminicella sporogenes]RKD25235.1 DEAD/DEAH box helicase [Caminicella sporogenes]SHK31864.1 type I restriction enzyme, R subunit [Caminicella sporogenes DSM 14501]
MPTNTKESGLEALIVNYLVNKNGFEQGTNEDYNRDYAVDETRLFRFLQETQPDEVEKIGILNSQHKKEQFLNRLQGEIAKRGIIDVLRKGISFYPVNLIMFYMTPSEKNIKAKEMFEKNIFSVTRQLMYSKNNTQLAIDLAIFINGLPIITCELKNRLTKQNVEDAVQQYKLDRDPRELLFQFKRCMVHFAVDDNEVKFCTRLEGKKSWFLPFNKGYNGGAGNPPNPNGIKTDYLWKEILTKNELANIIENYAQVVAEEDEYTKKKKYKQIFPRYHQLSVVKALLADVKEKGVGQKYLIQHSAGSGKSNSIAWTAHQLVGFEKDGKNIFDSVIVVTDRVNLDKQIKNTIKQFMQVSSTVGHAENSGDLKKLIKEGKKIIITTVQKFPYILDEIGTEHKGRNFAIIIDEAHSSQSGRMSAKMNMALSGEYTNDEEETVEDKIIKMMEGRKMLKNASYFAFTATPKNKTLEMFGIPVPNGDKVQYKPFHIYTMKQAIEEGFILDVLKYYTPISSYYKIAKIVEDDPMFDKKKAQKKLKKYVESNSYAIEQKADIMVTHFHEQVIAKGKIGGKARAMVVTSSIERAIDYYYAITKCLEKRKSPYKAIVAFSGEKEYKGKVLTEASINGFPSSQIETEFKKDPYRFLIVANKFQTGYDEPLLHTMYVDKVLSGIKAVQTLSRLNRAYPGKTDTFVLDFANDTDTIKKAFETYYTTTILSEETDPNKLYDLVTEMEQHQVYTDYHVNTLVELYLSGADRDRLDPILDACVGIYENLEEDEQVSFKSSAKAFVRTYSFLGAILPYGNAEWEKLALFLNLLIPKLPSPVEEDLSKGILDAIDLDSYRAEIKQTMSIILEDQTEYSVGPVPTKSGGGINEPEMDLLSNILESFHDMWGNIDWKDEDQVKRHIASIPAVVSKDVAYQNAMKNSDKQNARIESERALNRAMINMMADNMELFKQFNDNPSFKKWLSDMVFNLTYNTKGEVYTGEINI